MLLGFALCCSFFFAFAHRSTFVLSSFGVLRNGFASSHSLHASSFPPLNAIISRLGTSLLADSLLLFYFVLVPTAYDGFLISCHYIRSFYDRFVLWANHSQGLLPDQKRGEQGWIWSQRQTRPVRTSS